MANIDNISDELLAAYLEGNTNADETRLILEAMQSDAVLQETLGVAININIEECPSESASTMQVTVNKDSDILPMMQVAAESKENLCSILCEEFILRRHDINVDEKALIETARENNWLKKEGAPLHTIGQLLASKGLMIVRKYDATINDIVESISSDNDLIVVIDSDKLYPERPDEEDAPNHAVVITALDTSSKTISIYDPQKDTIIASPFYLFEKAWHESCNYMIRVLRSPEEYNPQPINLDHITLTDNLLELREAIAENAHDLWAAARIKEGWTYGPVRDDSKKQHPDLIPYSSLPDSEKEYDRLMALDTIKLVKKLGFEIVKK